jgi:hypothetical protein
MFVVGVAVGFAAHYAWQNYSRPIVNPPAA